MKQVLLYFLIFVFVLFLFSCEKMIETGAPRTQLTIDKAFADEQTTLSVLVSIYSSFNSSVVTNITPYVGLYSDEFTSNSTNVSVREFANSHVSAGNTPNHSIWRNLYSVVYQCNALLEALEVSNSLPLTAREQFKGEALFLRSLAYSFLTDLYGAVPLLLTTDVQVTSIAKRTEKAVINDQLIADLLMSKQLLKPGYVTTERVRANRWAAEALLARVYISEGNWVEAENSCTAILASGEYSLSNDLTNVFVKNSTETILQCWTQNGFSQVAPLLIPSGSSIPTYQISNSLLTSFDAGDQRRTAWVKSVVNNGTTYYHSFKYRNRVSVSGSNGEYSMMLRLGELYLLRAEARLKQNKFSEAEADLNTIRQRAGLTLLIGLQPTALENAILKERRIELFAEWGARFSDLKRFGKLDEQINILKPNWDPLRSILPIPQYEMLNNPSLTQNAGY
jgi:starch-binding outer membrane protein, SusD/RagB family